LAVGLLIIFLSTLYIHGLPELIYNTDFNGTMANYCFLSLLLIQIMEFFVVNSEHDSELA
jgi:hypothetical protein